MAIEKIQASENLVKLRIADYPNLKDKKRQEIYDAFAKKAQLGDKKKITSVDDLPSQLNGFLNGR